MKEGADSLLNAQDILQSSKTAHLGNILEFFSPSEKDDMNKFIKDHPNTTSSILWGKIEKTVRDRPSGQGRKVDLENNQLLKSIVIQFTYPRLDINVGGLCFGWLTNALQLLPEQFWLTFFFHMLDYLGCIVWPSTYGTHWEQIQEIIIYGYIHDEEFKSKHNLNTIKLKAIQATRL